MSSSSDLSGISPSLSSSSSSFPPLLSSSSSSLPSYASSSSELVSTSFTTPPPSSAAPLTPKRPADRKAAAERASSGITLTEDNNLQMPDGSVFSMTSSGQRLDRAQTEKFAALLSASLSQQLAKSKDFQTINISMNPTGGTIKRVKAAATGVTGAEGESKEEVQNVTFEKSRTKVISSQFTEAISSLNSDKKASASASTRADRESKEGASADRKRSGETDTSEPETSSRPGETDKKGKTKAAEPVETDPYRIATENARSKRLDETSRDHSRMNSDFHQKYTTANNVVYATERLEAHHTITDAIAMARANINRLQIALKDLDEPTSTTPTALVQHRKQLQMELAHYRRIAADADAYQKSYGGNVAIRGKHHDKTWADCNMFRDTCVDTDYDDAVAHYVPVPSNLHTEHVQAADKAETEIANFARTGVFTDERNGWFSLEFLKSLEKHSLDRVTPEKFKVEIYKKAAHIIKTLKKKVTVSNLKKEVKDMEDIPSAISTIESKLNKCKEELGSITNASDMMEMRIKIRQLQSALHALKQLQAIHMKEELASITFDRKLILRDKFIQLLAERVKNNKGLIRDGKFNLFHLGLVKGTHRKLDESGWMHDEGVMMEDMAAIFAEYNGKTIKRCPPDRNTAYIETDAAGEEVIYLPADCFPTEADAKLGDGERKEAVADGRGIRLNAIFANLSPTGDNHTGPQVETNRRALAALNAIPVSKPEHLISAIREYDTTTKNCLRRVKSKPWDYYYKQACKVLDNAKKEGFAIGTGCASGKDRGGTVSELLKLHILNQDKTEITIGEEPSTIGAAHAARHQHYLDHMYDDDSILTKVVQKNTGAGIPPKVWLHNVPGYSKLRVIRYGITFGLRTAWQKMTGPPGQKRFNEAVKKAFDENVEQYRTAQKQRDKPIKAKKGEEPVRTTPYED